MMGNSSTAPGSDDSRGRHYRLAAWLVTAAMFMEILDGTIITTALPSMARSFGSDAVHLNAAVSVYLLALGVFIPVSGWVADRIGARRTFTVAISIFTLSSLCCGLSDGFAIFVAIRAVQGAAGAMMVPVGRLVVLRSTPRERLLATMSSLVWPALVAPVVGPPLGGFITAHFGWRWIFYLNIPVGLIGGLAALIVIPDIRAEQRRPFDLQGFLLSGIGTFSLLVGLEWSVSHVGPESVALLLGGAGLVFLAWRHFRSAVSPMIDLAPLAMPTFRTAVRGGSLSRMSIGSAPFLLPLLFQLGFGFNAFHSGLLLLAVFAGNLAMKAATTRVLGWFGYRNVLIWNGVVIALTLSACGLLRRDTPLALTVPLLFAGGLARSMQFTALATIAFSDIPKPRMSDANSLFNTISQVSTAAGITLGALGIQLGASLGHMIGASQPDFAYRCAFPLVSIFALIASVNARNLSPDAGAGLVGGGR